MTKTFYLQKGKDRVEVYLSDVVADSCLNLCVPVSKGERLPSILDKFCSKIEANKTHLLAGQNILVTGNGSEGEPFVITGLASPAEGLKAIALTMPSGFVVQNSPLIQDGTLAVTTSLNGIVRGNGSGFSTAIIGGGLAFDGTTLSAVPSRLYGSHDNLYS